MALNAPFVATNTAPTGVENTGITRPIFRKNTTIETTTSLASGGVFTGPWHDSQADGTAFVLVSSVCNQTGGLNGLVLQESDDSSNTTFTRNVGTCTTPANTLNRAFGMIKARYWRVKYTNGATAASSVEITACAMNQPPSMVDDNTATTTGFLTQATPVFFPGTVGGISDNSLSSSITSVANGGGGGGAPIEAFVPVYGGAFSGTASTGLQGWSRPRTPTIFRTAQATASGNTAVWTPASNNKFRLLKYQVETTANAATTAGVVVTIGLQDATTDLNLTHDVFIPPAGVTPSSNQGYASGWQDLGQFGILSAAANNVLNVNLSVALTAGNVRILVCGTEE